MASSNHFIRNFEILDWAVLPSNNDGKRMNFIFLWMIRMLFFIIEILPTVVKIVTPIGSYDRMVHGEEENMKVYLQSSEYSNSIKHMHEMELKAKEELLQQHDAERELKRQIIEKMRNAQMKVADAAIAKWEAEQMARLLTLTVIPDSSPTTDDNDDDTITTVMV